MVNIQEENNVFGIVDLEAIIRIASNKTVPYEAVVYPAI